MSSFAGATVVVRPASWSPALTRQRALLVRAQTEFQLAVLTHDALQPDIEPTKETTSVWDALAFSGPAPERINGRLAMVGFVAALSVEAARGGGLLDQAGSGAGLGWFLTTAAVFSVASLVPLLQGQSVESKSSGVWSADAELWNGRFAMLGLVALAITEFITGTPFVNV
uniref:Uncharacterized protein n=1 Tax=Aegilops tauschii subsp. strangulata TaxID=200361 RepID=A0A453IIL4_AEGTS